MSTSEGVASTGGRSPDELVDQVGLLESEVADLRRRLAEGPASNRTLELRLADGVAFEGPAPTPVGAYHSGSLVWPTSISEGFPYTVGEAMACGRTVVCTNVGGVVEAVADAGLVVPPKDSTAFADACIELLLDDSRRRHLATRARDRVLGSFTLEASLNAYRDLYTRVGEGRGSRTAEELEPVLASVASAAGRAPVTRRPRLEAAS